MRSIKLAASTLALVAGSTMIPANASTTVSVCTFESQVVITPGVEPTPHEGSFATPEPGTITCHGAIEGTGTVEYHGLTGTAGGESCAADLQGVGVLSYTFNDFTVSGDFSFSRLGVVGAFNGVGDNASRIDGTFQFLPKDGQDCATVPVTQATVKGQAVITGYY